MTKNCPWEPHQLKFTDWTKGVPDSSENRRQEGATLKGGRQLADRTETIYHIHKDATDRYAPYLRHV